MQTEQFQWTGTYYAVKIQSDIGHWFYASAQKAPVSLWNRRKNAVGFRDELSKEALIPKKRLKIVKVRVQITDTCAKTKPKQTRR